MKFAILTIFNVQFNGISYTHNIVQPSLLFPKSFSTPNRNFVLIWTTWKDFWLYIDNYLQLYVRPLKKILFSLFFQGKFPVTHVTEVGFLQKAPWGTLLGNLSGQHLWGREGGRTGQETRCLGLQAFILPSGNPGPEISWIGTVRACLYTFVSSSRRMQQAQAWTMRTWAR